MIFDNPGPSATQVLCLWVLTSTKSAEMKGTVLFGFISSAAWEQRP